MLDKSKEVMTVGELLIKFFYYYRYTFLRDKQVISISHNVARLPKDNYRDELK